MSFKRAKVVMLPTNEKANINSIVKRKHRLNQEYLSLICCEDNQFDGFKQWSSGGELITLNHVIQTDENWPEASVQHLYFLSDDEIKEGDWKYDTFHKEISQVKSLNSISKYDKKIIATTDSSLGLPKPSESFIQKFVGSYNNFNPITEVMVGYLKGVTIVDEKQWENQELHLKVNPKDNTITIKKLKDSWSKTDEDLIKAFENFACAVYDTNYGKDMSIRQRAEIMSKQWIEENL